jgi:hypothetical protein
MSVGGTGFLPQRSVALFLVPTDPHVLPIVIYDPGASVATDEHGAFAQMLSFYAFWPGTFTLQASQFTWPATDTVTVQTTATYVIAVSPTPTRTPTSTPASSPTTTPTRTATPITTSTPTTVPTPA